MSDLTDKVAIVTGAGSGIGRAIALRFAAAGADVAIFDVDEEAATQTVEAIGDQARAYLVDLSDQEATAAAVGNIIYSYGKIDILVNNAGVAHIGTATTTSEDDFDRLMRINVKGVYNGLYTVLPHMMEAGTGAILNMASIASITGIPDRFAYSTTKGAVLTMTYSTAIDYIDYGIRCNAICPARVHTPFVDGFIANNYPGEEAAVFEKLSAAQPIGRMGQPSEIADLALYLCGEESSFITGQHFEIDGGFMNARK